jgi:hypothetical protein
MTTEKFYDQSSAIGASRALQAVIAKRRSELRTKRTKKLLSKSQPSVLKREGRQLTLPLELKAGHRNILECVRGTVAAGALAEASGRMPAHRR